jgi:hypothetical protein
MKTYIENTAAVVATSYCREETEHVRAFAGLTLTVTTARGQRFDVDLNVDGDDTAEMVGYFDHLAKVINRAGATSLPKRCAAQLNVAEKLALSDAKDDIENMQKRIAAAVAAVAS